MGRSRTRDEGKPSGFSLINLLAWQGRLGCTQPQRCCPVSMCCLASESQSSPIDIPEWEQRLRRSRTRDEGKPSGFSLIPLIALLARQGRLGSTQPQLVAQSPGVAWLQTFNEVPSIYRNGSSDCGEAALAMR